MEPVGFSMFQSLLNFLSCRHRRFTRPITSDGQTYVVCLECGKQFAYDWEAMHIGKRIGAESPKPRDKKLKYFAFGMALPITVMIGNAIRWRRRKESP